MPVFPPTDLNNLVKGVVADIGGEALSNSRSASIPQLPAGGFGVSSLNQSDDASTMVRSSRQAARTFDISGPGALRPRGLFYVVFRRAGSVDEWQRDVGFLVKSLDQPRIQPKAEELNQYNKKRQVYTGYDLSPVTMTLYDTADSTVTQMWSQYSKFFFGDFNQDKRNFSFDQLQPTMQGIDTGYGLTLHTSNDADEQNSQFFFTAVDIYKVFAGEFTKTTLVNPRITSFDPEDLDYGLMEALTFRMTFAYEAVLYENDGRPQSVFSDPDLKEIFGDPRGDADMIEVSGLSRSASTASDLGVFSFDSQNSSFLPTGTPLDGFAIDDGGSPRSGLGGVLGSFGNFDFGKLAGEAVNTVVSGRGLGSAGQELAFAATGNPALSTILGMTAARRPLTEIASQALSSFGSPRSVGLNPAVYDAARAAIAAKSGNSLAAGALTGQLTAGIIGGASLTGTRPVDQVASTSGGLRLVGSALSVVNSQRSGGSQIGFKLPNTSKGFPI